MVRANSMEWHSPPASMRYWWAEQRRSQAAAIRGRALSRAAAGVSAGTARRRRRGLGERHRGRDAQGPARAVLRLDPGTLAGNADRGIAADRIVDHARDRPVAVDERRHHPEQRQAGGVVPGTVDRVDDESGRAVGKRAEQRRVGRGSLLAEQGEPGNSASSPSVSDASEASSAIVTRSSGPDFSRTMPASEFAEMRHHLLGRPRLSKATTALISCFVIVSPNAPDRLRRAALPDGWRLRRHRAGGSRHVDTARRDARHPLGISHSMVVESRRASHR